MIKFTNLSAKVLSLALAGMVVIAGMNMPVGKKVEEVKQASKVSTLYQEIKKTNISTEELNRISEAALVEGSNTAMKINKFSDIVDYEAALNCAMTSYYETENFAEMAKFEETIDERSSEIIKGYKEAAVERKAGDANGYEAGTVLLYFDESTSIEDIEAMVEAEYGKCREIIECFNDDKVVVVDISLGQTVNMAEEAFEDYSIVEAADSNDYDLVAEVTGDYVNDTRAVDQYYLDSMQIKGAWDYVSQNAHEKVIVGVIDTGVDIYHKELRNVVSEKSAAVSSTDEVTLLSDLAEPYDNNHGTMVAGVIAAEANNNSMVAGVASCYDNSVVEILAVKASRKNTTTGAVSLPISYTVKAMNYCVENGAKVINYSGAGTTHNDARYKMLTAIKEAGIIFVCSAGNDCGNTVVYPSDYINTISIAASDANNVFGSFSGYGQYKDFVASGDAILTTTLGNAVTTTGGTSFSSPIAAAIVAMMCSVNMELNFNSVYEILENSCVDIGAGDKCKNGLINAHDAVVMAGSYGKLSAEDENASVDAVETTTIQENQVVTTEDTTTGIPVIIAPETTSEYEVIMPETTVSPSTNILEVIGLVANPAGDNAVSVVWGNDASRSAYKYNVYVNGEKKLSEVVCAYYVISNVNAGTANVKVTAVYGGSESAGVTLSVNITGTVVEETTVQVVTTEASVAELPTTEVKIEQATTTNADNGELKIKSVKASSVESEALSAGYVADDNSDTRWSSAWSDSEWIYVELEESQFIGNVEFVWEAAYASHYDVYVSEDGINWTKVSIVEYGNGGTDNIYIGRNAKYVKMQGVKRATTYGFSLYEINIFG